MGRLEKLCIQIAVCFFLFPSGRTLTSAAPFFSPSVIQISAISLGVPCPLVHEHETV